MKADFDQERASKDLLEEKGARVGETTRKCVAHRGDPAFYLQSSLVVYGCHGHS